MKLLRQRYKHHTNNPNRKNPNISQYSAQIAYWPHHPFHKSCPNSDEGNWERHGTPRKPRHYVLSTTDYDQQRGWDKTSEEESNFMEEKGVKINMTEWGMCPYRGWCLLNTVSLLKVARSCNGWWPLSGHRYYELYNNNCFVILRPSQFHTVLI